MKWLPIFVLVLLSSCSAQWHLTQAKKKDPSILKPTVVTKWDTVKIPPIIRRDTIRVPALNDSSVIENDSLRLVISKIKDEFGNEVLVVKTKIKEIKVPHYVQVECPPQVIYEDKRKWYDGLWWKLLIIFITIFGMKKIIDKTL